MINWDSSRAVPKPEPRKKGGKSPRAAGNRVEKIVADKLGEKRNVGSGAFKNTNKNLTGDIDVRDTAGKDFIKIEVKMSGAVNAKGEKSYTLTEPVLLQCEQEAHASGELAALAIHFKNGKTWVAMPFDDWKRLVELAKLGLEQQK